jgi:hypothetical protein
LMFVVMELITGNQTRVPSLTISAFGTPTVVHFCVALLISATLRALARACKRRPCARRRTSYTPVLEDWLWHAGLPFVAYAAIDLAGTQPTRRFTAGLGSALCRAAFLSHRQ